MAASLEPLAVGSRKYEVWTPLDGKIVESPGSYTKILLFSEFDWRQSPQAIVNAIPPHVKLDDASLTAVTILFPRKDRASRNQEDYDTKGDIRTGRERVGVAPRAKTSDGHEFYLVYGDYYVISGGEASPDTYLKAGHIQDNRNARSQTLSSFLSYGSVYARHHPTPSILFEFNRNGILMIPTVAMGQLHPAYFQAIINKPELGIDMNKDLEISAVHISKKRAQSAQKTPEFKRQRKSLSDTGVTPGSREVHSPVKSLEQTPTAKSADRASPSTLDPQTPDGNVRHGLDGPTQQQEEIQKLPGQPIMGSNSEIGREEQVLNGRQERLASAVEEPSMETTGHHSTELQTYDHQIPYRPITGHWEELAIYESDSAAEEMASVPTEPHDWVPNYLRSNEPMSGQDRLTNQSIHANKISDAARIANEILKNAKAIGLNTKWEHYHEYEKEYAIKMFLNFNTYAKLQNDQRDEYQRAEQHLKDLTAELARQQEQRARTQMMRIVIEHGAQCAQQLTNGNLLDMAAALRKTLEHLIKSTEWFPDGEINKIKNELQLLVQPVIWTGERIAAAESREKTRLEKDRKDRESGHRSRAVAMAKEAGVDLQHNPANWGPVKVQDFETPVQIDFEDSATQHLVCVDTKSRVFIMVPPNTSRTVVAEIALDPTKHLDEFGRPWKTFTLKLVLMDPDRTPENNKFGWTRLYAAHILVRKDDNGRLIEGDMEKQMDSGLFYNADATPYTWYNATKIPIQYDNWSDRYVLVNLDENDNFAQDQADFEASKGCFFTMTGLKYYNDDEYKLVPVPQTDDMFVKMEVDHKARYDNESFEEAIKHGPFYNRRGYPFLDRESSQSSSQPALDEAFTGNDGELISGDFDVVENMLQGTNTAALMAESSLKPGDWRCGCGHVNTRLQAECTRCNRVAAKIQTQLQQLTEPQAASILDSTVPDISTPVLTFEDYPIASPADEFDTEMTTWGFKF